MDSQINKGIIEICALFLISQKDYYGYPLMNELSQYFPDTDTSVFYSILRRFAKMGFTEIYLGNETGGPVRKYHRITEAGHKYLHEQSDYFKNVVSIAIRIGLYHVSDF